MLDPRVCSRRLDRCSNTLQLYQYFLRITLCTPLSLLHSFIFFQKFLLFLSSATMYHSPSFPSSS